MEVGLIWRPGFCELIPLRTIEAESRSESRWGNLPGQRYLPDSEQSGLEADRRLLRALIELEQLSLALISTPAFSSLVQRYFY